MSQRADWHPDRPAEEGGASVTLPAVGSAGALLLAHEADSPESLAWAPLLGRPLLAWTVAAFEAAPAIRTIVLAVAAERAADARALARTEGWRKTHVSPVVSAQRTPVQSRLHALETLDVLEALDPHLGVVVVHEGARPLITPELIAAAIRAAQQAGVAVAAEPVKETIKRVRDGVIQRTLPRERLVRAQTPAVFAASLLRSVLAATPAGLVRPLDLVGCTIASGFPVTLFPGSTENLRVATADDLAVAEALLLRRGRNEGGRA
jgi:2-C-methyl-D-erythritol 4-phosphate cytidylyltransferase